MNLTIRINDIEYRDCCAQGATFSEEYNETLDSAVIRLTHIPYVENLKPYDDVYIYDSKYDEYTLGTANFALQLSAWRQGGNLWDGKKSDGTGQPFYRHLLVDQFTESILNLSELIYDYSFELFSETKGLETVQCPNISITQPLNIKKKISVYTYLQRFVKLFSPKIKVASDSVNRLWDYKQKYTIDPGLEEIFGEIYSPDFTLSNPTLRDVLSQLMIVADCIPYVKDNVIYAKDISKRINRFSLADDKANGKINYISASLTSDDFCDSVRRQYSGALAQNGTCDYVEYLGFRNKDAAIMTLDNLQLETNFPIYKIKKLYMCYYKKGKYYKETISESDAVEAWVLCKQDITKLAKLSSEWSLLSQDWSEIQANPPTTVEDLSQYKLTTICYSQNSNTLTGWGSQYTEAIETLLNVVDTQRTYIENIFKFMDRNYPYGIYSEDYYVQAYKKDHIGTPYEKFVPSLSPDDVITQNMYAPSGLNSVSLKLKGFFFEIEYTGFYNGALIHSRDLGRDNIMHNDNASSSLSLLEKDGLNQKEKLNRFANKNYSFRGRYDSVLDMRQLGDYTSVNDEDDDVIIFKREYAIYNNMITCSYAAMQDYVLKNYFTSVYARYRTYQLMSYGESVLRAENRKTIFSLSKDAKYTDENTFFNLDTSLLFSAFGETEHYTTDAEVDRANTIDCGMIALKNGKEYAADEHTFTSGNSLCFNVTMGDNISGGNFIKSWSSSYKPLIAHNTDDPDYVKGSVQDWYDLVDDDETGAIKNLSFKVGHNNGVKEKYAKVSDVGKISSFYDYLQNLPLISQPGLVILETDIINNRSVLKFDYINTAQQTSGVVISYGKGEIDITSSTGVRFWYRTGDGLTGEGAVAQLFGTIPTNEATYAEYQQKYHGGNLKISMEEHRAGDPYVNVVNLFDIDQSPVRFFVEKPNGEKLFKKTYFASGLGDDVSSNGIINFFNTRFSDDVTIDDYPNIITVTIHANESDHKPEFWLWNADYAIWEKQPNNIYLYCYVYMDEIYWRGGYSGRFPNVIRSFPKDGAESVYAEKNNIIDVTEDFYKDNKERIDMTMQLEPISANQNDVVAGEWLVRLSDMLSTYEKVAKEYEVEYVDSDDRYIMHSKFYRINVTGDGYLYIGLHKNEVTHAGQTGLNLFTTLGNDSPKYMNYHINLFREETTAAYSKVRASVSYYGSQIYYDSTNDKVVIKGQGTAKYDYVPVSPLTPETHTTTPISDLEFNNPPSGSPLSQDYVWASIQGVEAAIASTENEYPYFADNTDRYIKRQKNMFLYYEQSKIDKTIVYKEHPYVGSSDTGYNTSFTKKIAENVLNPVKPEDLFNVSKALSSNKSYIRVKLKNIPYIADNSSTISYVNITTPGSIQYWYFDDKNSYSKNSTGTYTYSYTPEQSGYHFVFGVNISEEDIARGYVDIYINELTLRDNRVFDNLGRRVGTVHNAAGETAEPTAQKYDTFPINLNSDEFKYTVTFSTPQNATLSVKRIYNAKTQSVVDESLTSGTNIYYGDKLYVSITPNEGYTASTLGYNNSAPITGNIIITTAVIPITE